MVSLLTLPLRALQLFWVLICLRCIALSLRVHAKKSISARMDLALVRDLFRQTHVWALLRDHRQFVEWARMARNVALAVEIPQA